MADNVNIDPRIAGLAAEGEQRYGKLWKPIVEAAARGCQAEGVPQEALMYQALTRPDGAAIIGAKGVDQLAREESDGNKTSGTLRQQWHRQEYPNSMQARWEKGQK